MIVRFLSSFLALSLLITAPASGQDREVPYWASIRASKLNMRVGPSEDYKIDWVYSRQGLPVKVVRVMEGWRLIEDPDGARGWVVARLLSPERGAIVVGDGTTELRSDPAKNASIKWRVEPGVVGVLGDCEDGWCELAVGNRHGWIEQTRLWGAGKP
ncbi:MAG: SH3 domain-containing protein [Erythrobacter sp.]